MLPNILIRFVFGANCQEIVTLFSILPFIKMNQEELPLLSAIVQAYNIEQELLDRCVASVVQQTYPNMEILLINNCSTDDTTGRYCDEWAPKDNRIQVIHKIKDDYGLNSWEEAHGEYLVYIDHDDWIDPNMFTNMMSAMLTTNSDIARCEYCFAYHDGRIKYRDTTHKTASFEIIGRKEGVLLLLENKKWGAYRWQNIYKKHLFDFYLDPPVKNVWDDIAKTHLLFHHAKQTVYLHDVYYYYYQRPGSVVNQQNREQKKIRDYYRGNSIYARYLFVKQHPEYNSMLPALKKELAIIGIFSLWDMIDYPQAFPEDAYEEQIERLKQFSLSLRDGKFFFLNLDLFILKKIPRCYKSLYKIFYRNLRRIKILKNYAIKNEFE